MSTTFVIEGQLLTLSYGQPTKINYVLLMAPAAFELTGAPGYEDFEIDIQPGT